MQELLNKNQNINIFDYIGLKIDQIPSFFKINKTIEYDVHDIKKQNPYKVYKYIDVKDIDIFIKIESQDKILSISEILLNQNLKDEFIKICNMADIQKIKNIEIDQDKLGMSYPYCIEFNTDKEWCINYSKNQKKYIMLVSKQNNNLESMLVLLKNQILSNKENIIVKIYIPIENEDFSEEFLTDLQVTDIQNKLWFITNYRPKIYQVTDIYGNKSMQIIGKTNISNNLHTFYKIIIKNRKETKNVCQFIDRIFILNTNLKDFCKFEIKINENGIFQMFVNDEQILISNIDQFINDLSIKKIKEIDSIRLKNYELQIKIKENKEVIENKNEEFNQKQKQIVTFLQCKKTFFGRFKYFFKSSRKNKKISRIDKLPKIEIETKKEENIKTYQKKTNYMIDDLFAIYNILNENLKILKETSTENNSLIDKIDILNQKIKNADLYIKEIENHKKSIFEFWRFTNKDLPSEIMEGKNHNQLESTKNSEVDQNDLDYNVIKYEIEKIEQNSFTKNEQDAILAIKDYIDIIDYLESSENDDIIQNVLDTEKEKYEKIKQQHNIIYYNQNEDISILKNNNKDEILNKKYNILNLNSKTSLQEFRFKLLQLKKVVEQAYKKIKIPYNISIYNTIKNNTRTEWCIADLELESKILKEKSKQMDIIKFNVPKNSNIILGTCNMKNIGLEDNTVLINIKNFDISLKQKYKERICFIDNNYKEIIKDIKIYEYDLLNIKEVL